ncbi:MAG: phosphomannomutase/phosphoglucomutase [Kiritimatiellae bacterium]|nr:phosphomannomutase/phosphoglucomutase [Kiritimatiellia bacterium]
MSFFKAYDMRGTFGADFDLDTVFRVGRELPGVIGAKRFLIGRDCRSTSPDIAATLKRGLAEAGADVTDLGLATTPMVYFFTAEDDFDASVMITASHNPPTDNGLKVSKRGALPVGYESGLAEVERRIAGGDGTTGTSGATGTAGTAEGATDSARLARYVAWLRAHALPIGNLRFAVDCSDGMASILAHELFPGAVFINDVPDGSFPHHAPNPLLAASREQLAAVVREQGLDCGVIFDGDADRCMFVDEKGAFIQPDYLIPVLSSTYSEPNATVIHDVRTSRAAIEAIRAQGATPVIGKVGHAYAKVLLREVKAVCGGELAGHYYFRDFHGCDSGELAALRILGAFASAKTRGQTVSAFMAPLLDKYANSGEVNFKVEDKPAAIARVLEAARGLAPETGRTTIDGYRLEYDAGWVCVRQSNTEPYLRLIVECDTRARLDDWLARLTAAIERED